MRRTPILTLIFFFLLLIMLPVVVANGDEDDEEDESDIGKNLGVAAMGTLSIGLIYIIFRRSYVYSQKYLKDEQHGDLKRALKRLYREFRSPLLLIHNAAMFIATLLGVIHGIIVGLGEDGIGISGWIAAGFMILLSSSGIVIWLRFRPIWNFRKQRRMIRFIHQQWLFSGFLLVALFAHVAILEN
ncbi:MAG: hypothetical protein ACXAC2_11370 [Candidatus Kariarchaeaceae archaeon]